MFISHCGKEYMISVHDDRILVSDIGNAVHRIMKIYDCRLYTFKLTKRGIYAIDKGEGLEKYFKRCIRNDFSICKLATICNYVLENGKEMR